MQGFDQSPQFVFQLARAVEQQIVPDFPGDPGKCADQQRLVFLRPQLADRDDVTALSAVMNVEGPPPWA